MLIGGVSVAGILIVASTILGSVTDLAAVVGWAGFGPEAEDPSAGATLAPDATSDPTGADSEDSGASSSESGDELSATVWELEHTNLVMNVDYDSDDDGVCQVAMFDFDDASWGDEVWYSREIEPFEPGPYVDLIWDQCHEETDSDTLESTQLYTYDRAYAWLFPEGVQPTPEECDDVLRENYPSEFFWQIDDPQVPEEYGFEENRFICLKTGDGLLVLAEIINVNEADQYSWLGGQLVVTTYEPE
jgi:hypothetical protein